MLYKPQNKFMFPNDEFINNAVSNTFSSLVNGTKISNYILDVLYRTGYQTSTNWDEIISGGVTALNPALYDGDTFSVVFPANTISNVGSKYLNTTLGWRLTLLGDPKTAMAPVGMKTPNVQVTNHGLQTGEEVFIGYQFTNTYTSKNNVLVQMENTLDDMYYLNFYRAAGDCDTDASTAAKTITIAGYTTISVGDVIKVKFTKGSTVDSPTLSINSGTAIPIFYKGEALLATGLTIDIDKEIYLVYDGTNLNAQLKIENGDAVYNKENTPAMYVYAPTEEFYYKSTIYTGHTPVANDAARLALTGISAGYLVYQTDNHRTYCLTTSDPSVDDNWKVIGLRPNTSETIYPDLYYYDYAVLNATRRLASNASLYDLVYSIAESAMYLLVATPASTSTNWTKVSSSTSTSNLITSWKYIGDTTNKEITAHYKILNTNIVDNDTYLIGLTGSAGTLACAKDTKMVYLLTTNNPQLLTNWAGIGTATSDIVVDKDTTTETDIIYDLDISTLLIAKDAADFNSMTCAVGSKVYRTDDYCVHYVTAIDSSNHPTTSYGEGLFKLISTTLSQSYNATTLTKVSGQVARLALDVSVGTVVYQQDTASYFMLVNTKNIEANWFDLGWSPAFAYACVVDGDTIWLSSTRETALAGLSGGDNVLSQEQVVGRSIYPAAISDVIIFSTINKGTVTVAAATTSNKGEYTYYRDHGFTYAQENNIPLNETVFYLYDNKYNLLDESDVIISSNPSYTFSGLEAYTDYYVKIKSTDINGFSYTSNYGSLSTVFETVKVTSYDNSPTAEPIPQIGGIALTWDNIVPLVGQIKNNGTVQTYWNQVDPGTRPDNSYIVIDGMPNLELKTNDILAFYPVNKQSEGSLPMFVWHPTTTSFSGTIAMFENTEDGNSYEILYVTEDAENTDSVPYVGHKYNGGDIIIDSPNLTLNTDNNYIFKSDSLFVDVTTIPVIMKVSNITAITTSSSPAVSTILLTFDHDIESTGINKDDYRISTGGVVLPIASAEISGTNSILLTMTSSVNPGTTVAIKYTNWIDIPMYVAANELERTAGSFNLGDFVYQTNEQNTYELVNYGSDNEWIVVGSDNEYINFANAISHFHSVSADTSGRTSLTSIYAGYYVYQQDTGVMYMLTTNDPSVDSNWKAIGSTVGVSPGLNVLRSFDNKTVTF